MESAKLLLVDDQPENLTEMVNIIEASEKSYTLLQTFDAQTALTIAAKEQPDLIIIDWEMPLMNGVEAIKLLKKQAQNHDTPIVMCTGVMTTSSNLKIAFDAGANDFVRKPIDPVEFITRIKSTLLLHQYYKDKLYAEQKIKQLTEETLQNEITLRNQELVSKTLQLIENMQNNKEILHMLEELKQHAEGKVLSMVKVAIKNFKICKQEADWKTFRLKFEQVHPMFFTRLNQKHPELTNNDQKLCSFLRLGLTTKQIADLTHQNLNTVKTARKRLRKKLNLESQQNLSVFLETI